MRPRQGFSGTALQVMAVLSMTGDHIGAVMMRDGQIAWATVLRDMPALFALRAIGRAAFPIFAFLLAQGMVHTRSRKRFILRLAVFALLSELPFDLAFYGVGFYPHHQNIFFTLCLGAVCIALLDYGGRAFGVFAAMGMALIAQLLYTDYAALGVLTVLMFWLLAQKGRLGVVVVLLLFAGSFLIYDQWVNLFCLLSLPLLLCYNGTRGGPAGLVGKSIRKWGFYFYYPLHLLVLSALAGR
ncbi:TraX family protein [Oscillospiraceae bacterium LTW-04]|nr:TraX family protein [Oscillospiraceae bacterium MB24-C1]